MSSGASGSASAGPQGWRLPRHRTPPTPSQPDPKKTKTTDKDTEKEKDKDKDNKGKEAPRGRRGRKAGEDEEGDEASSVLPLLLKQTLRLSQVQRQLEATVRDTWLLPSSSGAVKAGMAAGAEYDRLVREEGAAHGRGPPHPHILMAFVEAAATATNDEEDEDPMAPKDKVKEKGGKGKDKKDKNDKDKDKEKEKPDDKSKNNEKDKEFREAAMKLSKALESATIEMVADLIPYFRLSSTFKPEVAKVELSVNPLPVNRYEGIEAEGAHLAMAVRSTMHRLVEMEGGKRKIGAAPRPAMERALQGELLRMSRRSG